MQLYYAPDRAADYVGLYIFFCFLVSVRGLYPPVKRRDPGEFSGVLTLRNVMLIAPAGALNALGGVSNFRALP